MMKDIRKILVDMGACDEAIEWSSGYTTLADAWLACECTNWMLWLIARLPGDTRRSVLVACAFARLALPYVREGEQTLHKIIELVERWAAGDDTVSRSQLQDAYIDAAAAYADAHAAIAHAAHAAHAAAVHAVVYAAAAVYAAYAVPAVYAAYAADAATAATAAAADAADADAYDADAARNKVRAECAAIVRLHYPADEIERLIIKWAENRIKFRG